MKKTIKMLLLLCTMTIVLVGCGSSSDEMKFEKLEWPKYENAKQIPKPKSDMAHVYNSNSVRFEFYLSNTTLEDYKAYVGECKNVGFIESAEEQETKYYAFNAERYELTLEYLDGDIMYVSVVEERYDVEIKLLHVDKSSADMYDLRVEIDDYWEEDSDKGDEAIVFESDLREGKHIMKIENDDDDDVCGRIEFVVSEEGEYFEFEIECMSSKIVISPVDGTSDEEETTVETVSSDGDTILSQSEAIQLFEKSFDQFNTLIDDLSATLEVTNFTSIEEIENYEKTWSDMSKDAKAIQDSLSEKTPPTKYTKVWELFATSMGKISDILKKGIEMDANQDGEYSGEEISELVTTIRDEFIAESELACEYAREYYDLLDDDSTVSSNSSSNNSSSNNSNKCIECGKKATKTYTNPFSGEKEYYCTSHYEEIIDMMSDMESDVGSSSYGKHTCEECSREGTHSITGISGQKEYYCSTHYEELQEMLKIFQ